MNRFLHRCDMAGWIAWNQPHQVLTQYKQIPIAAVGHLRQEFAVKTHSSSLVVLVLLAVFLRSHY